MTTKSWLHKLISNFTGAMSGDARSMAITSPDYLDDDGVERLLACIRRRLNIRDVGLETDAFEKFLNHMMRGKERHS